MTDDIDVPDMLPGAREAYLRTPAADIEAENRLIARLLAERHAPPEAPLLQIRRGHAHHARHHARHHVRRTHASRGVFRPALIGVALLAACALFAAGIAVGRLTGSRNLTTASRSETASSNALITPRAAATTAASPTRVVQFVLAAPTASRVTLVGDFNDWDTGATPMRFDRATGRWTVSVPLPSGRHVYAFVVDGDQWTPDPVAPRAANDGFGTPNSVLVVERLL